MSGLGRLLAPGSIAIVGVSADPGKHGRRVLANLWKVGFGGEIWGVNPKLPEIDGLDVVAELADLPAPPDVVVSAVPGPLVPAVVRQAGAVNAGVVIVFAGGFSEVGEAGRLLEDDLRAAIADSEVRVLGPNSGGIIRPAAGLAASFLTCLDRPADQIRSGPVGLVTQSGGTGSYIHNLAAGRGGGLAASISTGNEVDIDAADAIEALALQDEVRTIAVVLETVRHGGRFIRAVRSAHEAGKPVVVCHLGRTGHSAGMLATHTGALATDRRVLEGVCGSLGVTLVATPGELYDVAEVMARAGAVAGSRMGVVTHSGGVAILLADLAEGTAIALPEPSPEVRAELAPLIDLGTTANPLDMGAIIGGPHRFAEVVDIFSRHHDVVLAVSSAHPPAHTEQRVGALCGLGERPPIVHLWMAGDVGAGGLDGLRAAGLAVTEEPRAAIAAIDGLIRFSQAGLYAGDRVVSGLVPGAVETLSEHAAKAWLAGHGVAVVEGELVDSASAAVAAAEGLAGPVVVKVVSPDIVHKAEVGGVIVGVQDPAAAGEAFEAVLAGASTRAPQARIEGARVERHVSGIEMLVSAIVHPQFGPMVAVGVGGAGAEALGDVAMALAPVSTEHARRLVDSLVGAAVLDTTRFGAPADRDQLAAILVRLGGLVADGSATEIEINPLAWTGTEWLALDAVVRRAPE
jgi:acyl-CoA synthetase (NDP forming)